MDSNKKEKPPQKEGSFFSELSKRKVVQTAAIYGAVAWGVTEVVVTVVDQLFLPQWVSTLAVIFFVVGFPVAMFLAWTFDFTSEGIRRTTVTSRRGTASIVASMVLLVAGTAGLFFLIKPSLQVSEGAHATVLDIEANSIAVMPFTDAGVRQQDAYVVSGISDELRDQLTRVADLQVAARSSSVAAVEQGMDAVSSSQKLGVAYLVEGNVRSQGGVLRVSVQLINGQNGLTDWSETFERGPRELLSLQNEVVKAVISHLLPGAGDVEVTPATQDPTANEYMMLARFYETEVRERQEVNQEALMEAIRLYRQATDADPESALAFSRLAGALMYLGDITAAEAPIFKALSLNPELSEVQNTLGEFHWARGLVSEAGVAWARAVQLDPNNPEALANYAHWRWFQIETEGVEELYRRALDVDRLSLERYAALGTYLGLEGHYEEARVVIGQIDTLFNGPAAWRAMAFLHEFLGEFDRSIAYTIKARDSEPDNPSHVQKLAEYFADIGDADKALMLDPNGIGVLFKLRRYEDMISIAEFAMIDEPDSLRIRSLLGIAYNATGQFESTLHVISTTGVPDSVLNGWRSIEEMDAYQALTNALNAVGETETARELARISVYEIGYTDGFDFQLTVAQACDRAILGEDDEARNSMKRAMQGFRLAWDPVLKDAPCFERFQDDPVYQEMVEHFDAHRALMRERLPAILAEFGVSL